MAKISFRLDFEAEGAFPAFFADRLMYAVGKILPADCVAHIRCIDPSLPEDAIKIGTYGQSTEDVP